MYLPVGFLASFAKEGSRFRIQPVMHRYLMGGRFLKQLLGGGVIDIKGLHNTGGHSNIHPCTHRILRQGIAFVVQRLGGSFRFGFRFRGRNIEVVYVVTLPIGERTVDSHHNQGKK